MPEPTPAEELRTAAATLREHATDATKGPWWSEDTSPAQWGDNPDAKVACADGTLAVLCPEWNGPFNAAWIALMDPTVGIALADWLDAVAAEMTAVDGTEYAYEEYPSWIAALAVARAINGTPDAAVDPDHGAPAGAGVCDRCRPWEGGPDKFPGCPQCGQDWNRRIPAAPEEPSR
jgi:hypothetical protein